MILNLICDCYEYKIDDGCVTLNKIIGKSPDQFTMLRGDSLIIKLPGDGDDCPYNQTFSYTELVTGGYKGRPYNYKKILRLAHSPINIERRNL